MAVFGLQPVQAIISKVYRDFRIQDPNFEADAIEWIGEAIASIGVGPQHVRKTATVTVVGNRGDLPFDMLNLLDVTMTTNGHRVPLYNSSEVASYVPGDGESVSYPDSFASNGGMLHTSSDGEFEITYEGMALDESGMPMVPDNPLFSEALMWYIIMKMMTRGWQHPNPQISYLHASQKWQEYNTKARSKAKMPTIPELDTFLHNWVRMASMTDRRKEGFAPIGTSGHQGVMYGTRTRTNMVVNTGL